MANKTEEVKITEEMKIEAAKQIKEQQSETRYDLRDFTIDYIIQKWKWQVLLPIVR